MVDSDIELCCLCRLDRDIQRSHVIPAFVFRWLKDSSATGRLRSSFAWNKRVQDGLKLRWMCKKCEQRIGVWEKQFSEKIFLPLCSGEASRFRYGAWLLKFAVSVSWRVLLYFKQENNLGHLSREQMLQVNDTLEVWRRFLLDQNPHPDKHEQHMILSDVVFQSTIRDTPRNINRYLLRSVDIDIATTEDEAFVYVKMCRVILVGFVQIRKPRQWDGSKLHVRTGSIGNQTYTLPDHFGRYLLSRARKCDNFYDKISDRQARRIKVDYEKSMDKATKSETWAAMDADIILFGDKVFLSTDTRDKSGS